MFHWRYNTEENIVSYTFKKSNEAVLITVYVAAYPFVLHTLKSRSLLGYLRNRKKKKIRTLETEV